MSLSHRLQLLLDEEQFGRLAQRAKAEGRSVGSLVREAIDMVWIEPDASRRTSADVILAADPMPVPSPDDLRRELDDARERVLA